MRMSWLKLFLLPKCVLVSSKRRGRHHTPMSIGHLCNLWSQGQFDTLWEHATRQATPRDRHPRQRNARQSIVTAISLAREGLYGKACQALTSTGIAPNTDTTWELLRSKHPKGTPPTTPSIEALGTTILPQDSVDPQVALLLLRQCGGFCKLVHLSKSTPSSLVADALSLYSDDIRRCFTECTSVDTPDNAWQQAQLRYMYSICNANNETFNTIQSIHCLRPVLRIRIH